MQDSCCSPTMLNRTGRTGNHLADGIHIPPPSAIPTNAHWLNPESNAKFARMRYMTGPARRLPLRVQSDVIIVGSGIADVPAAVAAGRAGAAVCPTDTPGFAVAAEPVGTAPASRDMKIFLLIGQSNMAGRGAVDAQSEVTNPRVLVFGKDGAWQVARDPLHFDKPTMVGVGPGLAFGIEVANTLPGTTIGLVPAAFGGTSIDQWQKDSADPLKLYATAVERCREALRAGKLAGILWHQGEANRGTDPAEYAKKVDRLFTDLRTDLHAPEVPIIVGELGYFIPDVTQFNADMHSWAKHIPNTSVVTAEDLTDKGDKLHFDTDSARELGRRYAKAWLSHSRP